MCASAHSIDAKTKIHEENCFYMGKKSAYLKYRFQTYSKTGRYLKRCFDLQIMTRCAYLSNFF